jgi:RHS repeat-associated protein
LGRAHVAPTLSNGNFYTYDQNRNMITRHVGSQNFTFAYDAENRLVSVSGDSTASFTYDADGARVKSVMEGETTYFVGNHYEVTGSAVTKYYMAGTSRVAIRKVATLSYMLADHLGSTSLVTDAAGNRTSEMRYKPWGESRFSFGTLPTKYTFTGQFSYTDDPSTPQAEGFGLMYFNARWVDPQLGRFAQADTVIPPGASGYDRFAYATNNPIKFTDPTGHCSKTDDDYDICMEQLEYMEQKYSVTFQGAHQSTWSLSLLISLDKGMGKLRGAMGADAFGKLFSGTKFFVHGCKDGDNQMCAGSKYVNVGKDLAHVVDKYGSYAADYLEQGIVHELAHVWDYSCNLCMSGGMMAETGGSNLGGVYQPGGVPPTDYAAGNQYEDWAESVTSYLYPSRAQYPWDSIRQGFVADALANPLENP